MSLPSHTFIILLAAAFVASTARSTRDHQQQSVLGAHTVALAKHPFTYKNANGADRRAPRAAFAISQRYFVCSTDAVIASAGYMGCTGIVVANKYQGCGCLAHIQAPPDGEDTGTVAAAFVQRMVEWISAHSTVNGKADLEAVFWAGNSGAREIADVLAGLPVGVVHNEMGLRPPIGGLPRAGAYDPSTNELYLGTDLVHVAQGEGGDPPSKMRSGGVEMQDDSAVDEDSGRLIEAEKKARN